MTQRIVVVGAGYFAPFHLEGWQEAGAEVVAIADTDLQRAEALARRFGIAATFADAGAMFTATQPDIADVVLPPAAQFAVVQAALQLRIPTICQKPFGVDLQQAEVLAALARNSGVPLVVHENFRFTPWFRECRRWIDAGRFGRLHSLTFRLRPGDGQGAQAYLERQPYFQTMPQLLIRETGVHFIDSFRFLFGEVRAVTARLRRLNPAIVGEDAGLVIFEFDDDRQGLFDGNRLNDHVATNPRHTLGEMWLEGESGVMRLDGDGRLWWKPHHGLDAEHVYSGGRAVATGRPTSSTTSSATSSAFGGACTALQAHVLAHLRDGAALENGADDYLVNLRVQAAIYHSHASGTRVSMASFDPHASN